MDTPDEIKKKLPISEKQKRFIASSRQTAQQIVEGSNDSIAIIMGPCSIHDTSLALEYARRIKNLAEQSSFFLVMRVYCEKPRTTIGWKGLLYDPYLNGTHDIATGIYLTRELLLKLAEMGVPCATEFLDPIVAPYIEDLITWGFIGARTSSSQPHRQLASSLSIPIGFKNCHAGDIHPAIHGVIAARSSHVFVTVGGDGKICTKKSFGNNASHIVLRGSSEKPNYDKKSVQDALKAVHLHGIQSRILIDCSHGNSQKKYEKQKEVFLSVMEQIAQGNHSIMGVMLESHLLEGNQALNEDVSSLAYGVSITDPCIGWSTTEELLSCGEELLSTSSSLMRFTQS